MKQTFIRITQTHIKNMCWCRHLIHPHKHTETSGLSRFTWISFIIATTASFGVGILFRQGEFFQMNPVPDVPITSMHVHNVQPLIMLVELLLTPIPIRSADLVYPLVFSTAYTGALVTGHVVFGISQIYPVTDFANDPVAATLVTIGMVVIGVPVFHGVATLTSYVRDQALGISK